MYSEINVLHHTYKIIVIADGKNLGMQYNIVKLYL